MLGLSRLFFLSILCLPLGLSAQQQASVRNFAKNIDQNLWKYDVAEFNLEGESSEGGVIIQYLQNGETQKIEEVHMGEMGQVKWEYYLMGLELRMVRSTQDDYNVPFYLSKERAEEMGMKEYFDPEKTKTTINEYAFDNGKMVGWHYADEDMLINNDPKAFGKAAEILSNYKALLQKIGQ